MTVTIDLNSDLGEGYGPWAMGDDLAMLDVVGSANIACGGHAGDPETMFATLQAARQRGVVVGAHPGYQDREGFGRRVIPMTPDHICRMVAAQIGALSALAALVGTGVRYVKPHGALANVAADDVAVARAITDAVRAIDPDLAILAISGTTLEQEALRAGLRTYSEVFADRGYLPNGRLIPRTQPGAMIHDAGFAADRLLGFLATGQMPVQGGGATPLAAHSICVHGDSPGAVTFAKHIKDRLTDGGVAFAPFLQD